MQGTRTACPSCKEDTYGPVDRISPSGRKFHSDDCPIVVTCPRCGKEKGRFFELCKECSKKSCSFCGREGDEDDPLHQTVLHPFPHHKGCLADELRSRDR